MPLISTYFGIIIRMFFDEHNPPHFHASYQGHAATFSIEGELIEGSLPHKQRKLVEAWAQLHQDELLANWELLREGDAPTRIEPLR